MIINNFKVKENIAELTFKELATLKKDGLTALYPFLKDISNIDILTYVGKIYERSAKLKPSLVSPSFCEQAPYSKFLTCKIKAQKLEEDDLMLAVGCEYMQLKADFIIDKPVYFYLLTFKDIFLQFVKLLDDLADWLEAYKSSLSIEKKEAGWEDFYKVFSDYDFIINSANNSIYHINKILNMDTKTVLLHKKYLIAKYFHSKKEADIYVNKAKYDHRGRV